MQLSTPQMRQERIIRNYQHQHLPSMKIPKKEFREKQNLLNRAHQKAKIPKLNQETTRQRNQQRNHNSNKRKSRTETNHKPKERRPQDHRGKEDYPED